MRSLAVLVLLPILAAASENKNVERQNCKKDACVQAVGSWFFPDRRKDCKAFLGSTTVTGDLAVMTEYATVDAPAFTNLDNPATVVVPFTTTTTQQVTNTATIFAATITSTELAPLSAATSPVDKRTLNGLLSRIGGALLMPGGYPLYAAACRDKDRYISACNCAGVFAATITAPGSVSTTTLTITNSEGVQTGVNTVDQQTLSSVVATEVVTQTVDTTIQATATVTVTVPNNNNAQNTKSSNSGGSSGGGQMTATVLTTVLVPTVTTTLMPTSSSTDIPTDTASLSDLGDSTATSQSLSSADASDFPTSLLTATSATTTTSSAIATPTSVSQKFRLKVPSGSLINNYLMLRPYQDLGPENGGQAYMIAFSSDSAAASTWAFGGTKDMPSTSNSSIYSTDVASGGKVIAASVGMNSRLAVAAPGAGVAYLAASPLQCSVADTTNNVVKCSEAGVAGAPYANMGNCEDVMAIFKQANTCGSNGNLFFLTAEYV